MAPASLRGGDDLEDDFVLDELVELSADESIGEPQSLEVDTREDEEHSVDPKTTAANKRKRREKQKERKKKRLDSSKSNSLFQLGSFTPHELEEYLFAWQSKTFDKLSSLELEDLRIPESSIANTVEWTGHRALSDLEGFIMKTLPTLCTRLGQKSRSNGAPTLIFVASSALRVLDVSRTFKASKLRGDKSGQVAKLFSKHCKLEEHVAYLEKTKVGVAVGTPGRFGKLLQAGALSLSALSHMILDVTFEDVKKRSLMDIAEMRDELFKTVLGFPELHNAIKEGQVQIVIY